MTFIPLWTGLLLFAAGIIAGAGLTPFLIMYYVWTRIKKFMDEIEIHWKPYDKKPD